MQTRLATMYDLPKVYELAVAGYQESRYARYPLRPEKFERLAALAEQQPDEVFVVLVTEGDQVLGFLCGLVTEHFFAGMTYATNMAIYVAPAHRGSRAAFRLIRAFERVARERGASEILLGTSSGVAAKRTEQLYNAAGYETLGAVTVKYLESDHVR